jgi:hypothetical protein
MCYTENVMQKCKLCGKIYRDYQGRNRTRCGSCNTKIRRFRAKAAAISFLGGKCRDCGWSGHQSVLEFHHLNTQRKEFAIGNVANKKWDVIKRELNKCLLLCANCHAVRHSTKSEEKFLREVENYRGRRLEM